MKTLKRVLLILVTFAVIAVVLLALAYFFGWEVFWNVWAISLIVVGCGLLIVGLFIFSFNNKK